MLHAVCWVYYMPCSSRILIPTWNRWAWCKWITGIPLWARTYWGMIHNWAYRVCTTRTRTRINTLLINTSSIGATFRIYSALWTTIRRNTDIISHARTSWTVTTDMTLWIGTTRWGFTGIHRLHWLWCSWNNK